MSLIRPIKNERGSTYVEHLVALPLYFFLLVVSFDLLRVAYNALSVQFVVTRVMRQASVYEPKKGYMTSAEILQTVKQYGNGLGVPLDDQHISMCTVDNYPCSGVSPGDSTELVALRVNVPIDGLMLGSTFSRLTKGTFEIDALALSRKEPK